jgi:hypothetical protein
MNFLKMKYGTRMMVERQRYPENEFTSGSRTHRLVSMRDLFILGGRFV